MRSAAAWLLGYAALYALLAGLMAAREGYGLAEPLLILSVVGVGFSAAAWLATRGAIPHRIPVHRPAAECALLAAYLLVVVAYTTWGTPAVHRAASGPASDTLLVGAVKLLVFVALPLLLLRFWWGYRAADFVDAGASWRGHTRALLLMSALLLAFQSVVGRGLRELRAASPAPIAVIVAVPLAFAWLVLEVGLVEEFFFRAFLQARAAAWLRSEAGGLVVSALIFGLAHAPGLYLRTLTTGEALGPSPSLLMAVGYSVVITSVAGLFLGVLWIRTRNLLLLVLVHAAGDLVPNLLPLMRAFRLASSG